jgi:hypothetical protein
MWSDLIIFSLPLIYQYVVLVRLISDTDLEIQFLTQLDGLLKRKVLTEQEFARANEVTRAKKEELEARKAEFATLLSNAMATEALVEKVPKAILAFEEAFESLEVRQQKAHLQAILKAATIYKDGRIELEFRGESA